MNEGTTLAFDQPDLAAALAELDAEQLDDLEFGVIGIDAEAVVRLYNSCASKFAGLSPSQVLGQRLFTAVAPCMNNYMVAQRDAMCSCVACRTKNVVRHRERI